MSGYLVGTFPTADLVAKRSSKGLVKLRETGSGNPGAANALKILGKRAGYTIMIGDIAKGAFGSAAGRAIAGAVGAHLGGTASVVGHCFPVWTKFKGGKGVAASIGQCLATFPAYFPIDMAVAAVTASNPHLKSRAFTATMFSSGAWIIGGLVWWRKNLGNLWGPQPGPALPLAAAASSAVIAYRFVTAKAPEPVLL
jgi:acyl phosphate:glycerol-3-phosphate acyltransferase